VAVGIRPPNRNLGQRSGRRDAAQAASARHIGGGRMPKDEWGIGDDRIMKEELETMG
jgi:hypothetical protein